MDDPFITITGGLLCVMVVLAGWSTVRYELDTANGWRIAKYATNVLALVLGFGLGQAVALKLGVLRGLAPDNMLVTIVGSFAGAFIVMWAVQMIEYALRRHHGLPPMPYRLVRFDLFRW